MRDRLREPGLSNSERATLRLRADVLSHLLAAHEKLARLPQSTAPDDWLRAYRAHGLTPPAKKTHVSVQDARGGMLGSSPT